MAGRGTPGAEVRRVLYRLPRAAPDGRTVLALSPLEFLDRGPRATHVAWGRGAVAHLIPPPRVHRHRYHGVLAPHVRLRPQISAWAQQAVAPEPAPAAEPAPSAPDFDTPSPDSRRAAPTTAPSSQPSATPSNLSAPTSLWARLLARIYEVLPLVCPACGGELRIIAFLTEPHPVRAILQHLGLPFRPPPLALARGPPAVAFDLGRSEFDFDQTPTFDPSDPEPIPKFEFDQRRRT